jgi:hypothetical protein
LFIRKRSDFGYNQRLDRPVNNGPCSDTTGIDDRAALRLYREVARENRRRRDANDFKWQGQAFSLDPALYGA